ncbi:phosphoadenosine phosphosulfate reductase family protein (plasmid) [Pontibacillus sp. ALD_SL1]|uniref:phosphoadenosine phosphosulfate reductase domain-containing protein n=1 Tax=Pontibacillus sp. ALD_SL1 TaxID=2777185 RepID=UPI001A96FC87|nr:phosphoadenosine phosphosulfate reductase family protein [Pontibacillus sp. ALD_SL1]QST02235.1 phosphoadenosine phosphosulfate reductase family protein [Pontibacillus sp. ALD_SL1]
MKTILSTFQQEDKDHIKTVLSFMGILHTSDVTPEWIKETDIVCNSSLFIDEDKDVLETQLDPSILPDFLLFHNKDHNSTDPSLFPESVRDSIENIRNAYLDPSNNRTWIIAFSGGKDSTLLGICVWLAVKDLPSHQRKRKILFLTSDTGLEHKQMQEYMEDCVVKINDAAAEAGFGMIQSYLVKPRFQDRFGPKVIGRGMPLPTPQNPNQWCTDNWKIKPVNDFIKNHLETSGEVVIFTGGRDDESEHREDSLDRNGGDTFIFPKMENGKEAKGQYMSFPIQHIRNEELWYTLKQFKNSDFPWGISYQQLYDLYENTGECPMQLTTNNSNCGNSRNGCTICLMPKDDKMLEYFSKQKQEWADHMIILRTKIRTVLFDAYFRRNPSKFKIKHDLDQYNAFIEDKHEVKTERNFKGKGATAKRRAYNEERRNDQASWERKSQPLLAGTSPVYPDNALGSHSLEARIFLLKNVLYYQKLAGLTLVSDEEIPYILECWKEEFHWEYNEEDVKPEPVERDEVLVLKKDYRINRGQVTTIQNLVLPEEHDYKSGKIRILNENRNSPYRYLYYIHRDFGGSETSIIDHLTRSELETGKTIPYFFNNAWKTNEDGGITYWNRVGFVMVIEGNPFLEARDDYREEAWELVDSYIKSGEQEEETFSWAQSMNR